MKFDAAAFKIQKDFYMYYLEYYIDNCLVFIDEYLKESDQSISLNKSKASLNPKLKTNLTVPQIAYLFKLLNDLNPEIFETDAKTDISNFIANSFITKATEKNGISHKSVYNLLSNVEKETANFWATRLQKMLQEARKV